MSGQAEGSLLTVWNNEDEGMFEIISTSRQHLYENSGNNTDRANEKKRKRDRTWNLFVVIDILNV